MLTTVTVAVAAFIATNVDGLLVLIGFFSDQSLNPRQIVAGQFLGMGLLIMAGLGCAAAAIVLPDH